MSLRLQQCTTTLRSSNLRYPPPLIHKQYGSYYFKCVWRHCIMMLAGLVLRPLVACITGYSYYLYFSTLDLLLYCLRFQGVRASVQE